MNKQALPKQNTVNKQAVEILRSFVMESVDSFVEEHDIYDSIRSFQRLRFEMSQKNPEKPSCKAMDALAELLIDIAESRAKYNQLILDSYEQEQD